MPFNTNLYYNTLIELNYVGGVMTWLKLENKIDRITQFPLEKITDKEIVHIEYHGNTIYSLVLDGEMLEIHLTVVDIPTDEDQNVLYKNIKESDGPMVNYCPEFLLEKSNCQNRTAVMWRNICRNSQ